MTPDRPDHTPDDAENGVLSDTASVDASGIGILGGSTAQVNVELPSEQEDADLVDDDVIGGAMPFVVEIPADTAEAELVGTVEAAEWTVEDDVEDWQPVEDIADADVVHEESISGEAAAVVPPREEKTDAAASVPVVPAPAPASAPAESSAPVERLPYPGPTSP